MDLSTPLSRRAALCTCLVGSLKAARAFADLSRGEAAPHFVARTTAGEKLTNDSLKGKVVLIEFWATWCQYCKKDEAALESLTSEFKKNGLVVLAVNMGESRRKVKNTWKAHPAPAKSCWPKTPR